MINRIAAWSSVLLLACGAGCATTAPRKSAPDVPVASASGVEAARAALQRGELAKAAQAIDALAPAARPRELMTAIATQWARGDFAAAAKWAADQSDRSAQEATLAATAVGLAMNRPAVALAFACEVLAPGQTRDEAVETVSTMWAGSDARAAASAAEHLAAAELRERASVAIVRTWGTVDRDPAAAREWVLQQPAGLRERLIAVYARVRAVEQPLEAAGMVIVELPPGARRDEAFDGVLREWAATDLPGLRTWIGSITDAVLKKWAQARLDAASESGSPNKTTP